MKEKSKDNHQKESTYERSLKHPEHMDFVLKSQESDVEAYKKIILNWDSYRRIVGYSIRYANDEMKPSELKEVYGILVGTIENEKIIIKDAIPMIFGDRAGVEYENKQYGNMEQIDTSIYEKAIEDKEKDFIIGWWHTHPGFGFFFSPIDNLTQLGYQDSNPHAIGLIFDYCKKNNNSLGIAALRLKNPKRATFSDFVKIRMTYEPKKSSMLKKINKLITEIKKDKKSIEENIKYIQETTYKKSLFQLHEKYGLISEREIEYLLISESKESEQKLFVWREDKKEDKLPPFRESIEKEIKKQESILRKLLNGGSKEKFEKTKDKISKKIKLKLDNPKKLVDSIEETYSKKKNMILKYYDYFDTNERMLLERIEKFIEQYHEILDTLYLQIEFNI
ncbi:MAG: hypothetical protein JXA99_10445 [Candidatus Lokiarchaeota archaeon]|nr:hypothetical protein [Candidatus Lokiarchaeota archaeon]